MTDNFQSGPDEAYIDRNLAVQVLAILAKQKWYQIGIRNREDDWPILYVDLPTGQVYWQYHGFLRMATCTNYNSKVYIVEKEAKFNGYDVKCNHCSYIWRFTGQAKRTTCPNCEQKVDTEKNRLPDSDDSNVTV